jgi:hypothetical protein
LGREGAELNRFVENVSRYQNGEPLEAESFLDRAQPQGQEKVAAKEDAMNIKKSSSPKKKEKTTTASAYHRKKQNVNKTCKAPQESTTNRKSPLPPSMRVGSPFGKTHFAASGNGNGDDNATPATSGDAHLPCTSPKSSSKPEHTVHKSHPNRGKASKVCGCFGTKHKALTNCLYCGRISCELEGYDFCAYCGYMVEEIQSGE